MQLAPKTPVRKPKPFPEWNQPVCDLADSINREALENAGGPGVRVLVVGQSHMYSLIEAAHDMRQRGDFPALTMAFIQLRHPRYNPVFVRGGDSLNPNIAKEVNDHLEHADVVVSCTGGNAHAVLGLLNHTLPYDFWLETGEPLLGGREVVPCSLVKASLKAHMRPALKLLSALRKLTGKPMIHCEAPPPIPSEEHIRAHPGIFAQRIDQVGVAPASFRLKLWKLQSEIYREFCAAHDVEFLPVPQEIADGDGLMASAAWGTDPTHGNIWYGERVILQLANRLAPGKVPVNA